FNKRIKNNIKTIKRLPKIKGVKEILYPGQSKFNRFKSNLKKEINISKAVLKDLEYLQSI
ncbi:Ldh family oxidoreductase, partial [Candidatus Pelagibacter bacterium]|nr:Ldh family oxidoreductase [Candidatus Pelagibacter bacterium]